MVLGHPILVMGVIAMVLGLVMVLGHPILTLVVVVSNLGRSHLYLLNKNLICKAYRILKI